MFVNNGLASSVLYKDSTETFITGHFTATFRTVSTDHSIISASLSALLNRHEGSTRASSAANYGHEKSHRQKLKATQRLVGSPRTARQREKNGTEPFDSKTGRLQEANH